MKRFIAVTLSAFVFIAVFSGCGFKISDLIKITPITTAVASNVASQQEPASSLNNAQTSVQETQASSSNSEGSSSTTSQTTTKPAQTTTKPAQTTTKPTQTTVNPGIQPDGVYTTKADVSLYIHTYGKLPNNFITKAQAAALNWPNGGSLEPYAPGKCIGGDYFGNREGLLPAASGRTYFECDIDTLRASSRGAKRLVYSNDGLIYYTADHYEHFTKLY